MSTATKTAPECCPFCGAALGCIASGKPAIGEDRDWARFECGTYWYREYENQREDQTPICIIAERERLTRERDGLREAHTNALNQIGDLCMENAKLLARVKRLEEAGDAIVDHNIGCGCGQDGPCRACRMACEAWTKAKEATR